LESSIDEIQAVSKCVTKFTITDLYLMMGRELEPIDSVPCGNIAAIGGLKQLILKSATISTTLFCPSFTSMNLQTTPIVRVAVEPKNPSKIKDLLRGLKLLNQADPCVEIMVLENGEHILCAAGEVHLQRCIDDLVKQFAKCEVNVSPPIIPFKETIVKQTGKVSGAEAQDQSKSSNQKANKFDDDLDSAATTSTSSPAAANTNPNAATIVVGPEGRIEMNSADKRIRVWMKAKPLPSDFVRLLDESAQMAKLLNRVNQNKLEVNPTEYHAVLTEFRESLRKSFAEARADDEYYTHKDWDELVDRIVSFGPNRFGPNVLVNALGSLENSEENDSLNNVWTVLDGIAAGGGQRSSSPSSTSKPKQHTANSLKDFENNIIFGFNLATGSFFLFTLTCNIFKLKAYLIALIFKPKAHFAKSQSKAWPFLSRIFKFCLVAAKTCFLVR
jgi:ribosome assembly protein 1